jgi:hypothetical protein
VKDLEQFLLDRAMEHDSPGLLFTVAGEYLISAKTIRPGVVILAKMVASARAARPRPSGCGPRRAARFRWPA